MKYQLTRLLPWLVAFLAALGLPAAALAQQPSPEYYGPHMWNGGWCFAPIMMIVFIAVVVVVIVLLVRWLGGGHPGYGMGHAMHGPLGKTPLDILKERFARGEIDKEEFEERRRLLSD